MSRISITGCAAPMPMPTPILWRSLLPASECRAPSVELRWPRWRFGELHDIPLFESALHGLIFPDETLNLRVQAVLQQIKEIMKAGR